MQLGLVIPLFNEEVLAAEVVADILKVLEAAKIPHTLVLVNNGSTDRTAAIVDELAERATIEAIHLRENAGYGGGILAGIAHLEQSESPPEILGWSWGDGQVRPSVLAPLYRGIAGGADLAKAVRTERKDGLKRTLITTCYAEVMRALGAATPDVNGCPKLIRASALSTLDLRATDWFLDAEVVLGAEAAKMRIVQHPVSMEPRAGGKSKVGLATVAEFAVNLSRWRMTHRL